MRREPQEEGNRDRRDLERQVRKLKKDFQKNVLPAVKRNRFYMSKSETRRMKDRKAARRLRRQMRKWGSR